ncbi:unnamed protein product [Phytophthora fragariaefolia]|uniref:Unnamed protein product n=1 Tax=Phytophthora fragariaefolia TaxID=1490495 RepID=A0A9W6TRP8_9STRA|nr:unnamed protein product [Phytophthora fragariaefolia]
MSLGEYKKARGNALYARDELEALFDVGRDADMEDEEEEDEGTSSSTRVDPSVGSRRLREDDSDASSSKRSRSGSDRPLADAGPLSSPRSGGDSTSSGTVVSRTGPVNDPWMPTPSEIQSRFGSTAPPSQYALYACSGIKDDDVIKELDFDPATDSFMSSDDTGVRRLPVEAECPNGSQSWGAFVENFNKDPAGYRERVRLARRKSFPTNTKMIRTLGPDLTTNNSLDDPASCPLCVLQWGWMRWKDATGLVRQTPMIVWRLLNASRRPSLPR